MINFLHYGNRRQTYGLVRELAISYKCKRLCLDGLPDYIKEKF